jgi:Ca2+-binding EF-hand superfamily protein
MLLAMLQRMDQTQFTPDPSASDTSKPASATASASTSTSSCAGGSGKTALSSDILRVLMAMQEQAAPQATQAGAANDPAQQLFAAMDSDGDGAVSQSEMESYIEQQGGTQQQADTLYSSLNPSGAAGITESDIASDAQQTAGAAQGHHHHHHHKGGGIADKAAQDLTQLADTNQDGQVSQNEFESLISQLGGSTSEADQDYAALTAGAGTLTASTLASALKTLDASKVDLTAQTSPILAVLDALGSQSVKPASSGTA